jgi:hypothetical protein
VDKELEPAPAPAPTPPNRAQRRAHAVKERQSLRRLKKLMEQKARKRFAQVKQAQSEETAADYRIG